MYYLSECLIIKDENHYLIEHLTKSLQAGVEHIFIYDNESSTPVSDFLKDYPDLFNKCTIEIYKTNGSGICQIDCYTKFINDHRNDTEWCAFIDTDEMLEGNLKDLINLYKDYFSLRIHQIVHGANGQAYADYSKTMTERFQEHVVTFPMVKMVVKMKYLDKQFPHHSYLNDEAIVKDIQFWMKDVTWNETCQLHHYFYKSFEEWLIKIAKRGSVISSFNWELNKFFEENTIPEKDKIELLEKYNISLK